MGNAELIAKMKAWCLENYENGADTMVECWEDEDYEDLIVRCDGNEADSWDVLKSIAGVYAERQADARYYREMARFHGEDA